MTSNELWEKLLEGSGNTPLATGEFAQLVGLSEDKIRKVYQQWCQQGKLTKDGNKYLFVKTQEPELKIESVIQEEPIAEEPIFHTESPTQEEPQALGNIMRTVSGVIGTLLMVISINFTYMFNKLGMFAFWALLLSIAIVSFMCLAFTLKSYMETKLSRVMTIVLWVLGIFYSVFTAVSGQYNSFRKYNASDTSTIVSEQKELNDNRIKELQERYNNLLYVRDLEKEYTLNPDLKVENPGTWSKIKTDVAELKQLETDIKELQDVQWNLVGNDTINNTTVYHWLSETTGIDADILQLLIILFPALFMDLCSTLCLSFALSKRKVPTISTIQ